MTESGERIPWSIERRLEFIDFRLFWEGRINRSDLVRFFGISVPQASSDLGRYQETAKGNLVYDKTAKAYVAGQDYKPRFFNPSADRYLAQFRLIAAGLLTKEESWLESEPPVAIVPLVQRRLDAEALRRVLEATKLGAAVFIRYQSFSHPEPVWRWITPHALAFDGSRWHTRAWCHNNKEFRDFVLARILEIGEMKADQIDPLRDAGWQREVTLKLAPHPDLKDGRRKAIELDYGMVDGVLEIRTHVCLSSYVERQLGLDLDPRKVPSNRQQIVLINRDEVDSARRDAQSAPG